MSHLKIIRSINYFRILLIIFSFSCKMMTAQETYYISSSDGDDLYDGLSTNYDGTHGPWKTLAKVKNTSVGSRDSILLKRGDAWCEQLYVRASGSSSGNKYYGAYGSGDKPIVNCADTIIGWTVYSGNIWSAKIDTSIKEIPQIFLDGERQIIARWPNSGWSTIDGTATTGTYLYDESLTQADNYWVGATLKIRYCDWAIDTREITASSSSSNTITWGTALYYNKTAKTGYGYYLENKLALVDSIGEWFFDADTHTLYLQVSPGDDPNNRIIEATVREDGIKIAYKDYITIENLDVRNAGDRGIVMVGNYCNVINNVVSNTVNRGIHCVFAKNCTIDSNTVEANEGGFGVYVYDVPNCRITDNVLKDLGTDFLSYEASTGIYINESENSEITGNTITNISASGMCISSGPVYIAKNKISNCLEVLNDGGAIYLISDQTGSIIEKNEIYNNYGNNTGTPDNEVSAVGLYMDETSCYGIFQNNIVYDCNKGFHLHRAHDTKIYNNVFYNNDIGLSIQESAANQMYGNSIVNNVFYSTINLQYAMRVIRSTGSTNSVGDFNNNLFYNPYTTDVIRYGTWASYPYHTLSEWQTVTGIDSGNGSNSIQANPSLQDVSNDDFHLTTSSPCIDAGTDVGVTEDFDGVSVPHGNYPDIGAYESESDSNPTGFNNIEEDNMSLFAFPNPFNNELNIVYRADDTEEVELSVFDINGRKIAVLESSKLAYGMHTYKWNAKDYPGGLYLLCLQTQRTLKTMKISLVE